METIHLPPIHLAAFTPIESDVDAIRFFESVIAELGGGFHPDDSFGGYIESGTGRKTFAPEFAAILDSQLDSAIGQFNFGLDQYEIGLALIGHDMNAETREIKRHSAMSEFSDFDNIAEMELIHAALPGFYDSSWHNDVCPSLMWNPDKENRPEIGVRVWCDYRDDSEREIPGALRYVVYRDVDGEHSEEIETDSVAAVIEHARRLQGGVWPE